jgi:D-xylose transport system permease protein
LTNLILQIAATGTMAVGIFVVLLIGEIDLSVGVVSGLSGALLGLLAVNHGFSSGAAIGITLLAGLAIGLVHGFFVVRFRVPSFVVTLAGLIGWQGLQLQLLGNGGSIIFPESGITRLTSSFLNTVPAVILGVAVCAVYGASLLRTRSRRMRGELPAMSMRSALIRIILVAAAVSATVLVMERDRGLPVALIIFVGIVAAVDLGIRHTHIGRYMLAIGGNAEAGRRAGVPVDGVRIGVLAFCAMMAAAGGILSASRLLSVSASSGAGDTLLNAIAAVVIGGTSLFGGRGTAYSALLGILVIGSISNGMDLLNLGSPVKFMITGVVLLIAVSLDALSRARR